jgi:ribosomal protein S12 methylthiotransferase accessory factor
VYAPADLFSFAYGTAGVVRTVRRRGTNGLASGNSAYEAIAHGLYELVERDAIVLSNFGPSRALANPRGRLAELVDQIERAGVEILLFDLTSDLGVPVYQAYLVDACGFDAYHLHSGAGCHHDPEVALARAITEACQVRLTYFVGAREDVADPTVDEAAYRALRRCHGEAAPAAPPEAPPPGDLAVAIADLLERLAAAGCPDVYAASLSLHGFDQVAIRCYVPGLEGPYHDEAGNLLVGARAWEQRERWGPRRFGF